MDEILVTENISKQYPGVLALDGVNFSMEVGEIRALLGKNGAGKSTLIRVITGVETPDKGLVIIDKKILKGHGSQRTQHASQYGISPVYQELSLVDGMTVAENIYLGCWPVKWKSIDYKSMYVECDKIIHSLGFNLSSTSLVSSLSPAEQQMVEIARAMAKSSKLIILDEPTSSLSGSEVTQLFRAIKRVSNSGVAILYVSHRMKEIREIATSATIMRNGKIIDTVEISKTDNESIINMMLGTPSVAKNITPVNLDSNKKQGQKILSVHEICYQTRLKNVSFDLYKGEVLGIAGLLGSGRTEILKIIAGLIKPSSGNIILDGRNILHLKYKPRIKNGIAITPENRKNEGIFDQLGVDENTVVSNWLKVSNLGVLNKNMIFRETQKIIDLMNITTRSPSEIIGNLSGGNQQKVVIGRWIYAGTQILLLDEPTRGIDVKAKAQLYEIIKELALRGISVIFVSSELEELPEVCDRIHVLREGCIQKEYVFPFNNLDEIIAECMN